jgi:hypothetical protein
MDSVCTLQRQKEQEEDRVLKLCEDLFVGRQQSIDSQEIVGEAETLRVTE